MLKKWELARYIIDAKKCIDSLMYIDDNFDSICNINVAEKIKSLQNAFYTNCCYVLEDVVGKEKRKVCDNDKIVDRIYYERDKNTAHKDLSYKQRNYSSRKDMIEDMKMQINHIRNLYSNFLPEGLSLDFVSHDHDLFRLVNNISPVLEEQIKKMQHPGYKSKEEYPIYPDDNSTKTYTVFNDTEEIRNIDKQNTSDYATILECGLIFEETLQNLQDGCIRTNVLHNSDLWITPNSEALIKMQELQNKGFADKYGTFRFPPLTDYKFWKEIYKL